MNSVPASKMSAVQTEQVRSLQYMSQNIIFHLESNYEYLGETIGVERYFSSDWARLEELGSISIDLK